VGGKVIFTRPLFVLYGESVMKYTGAAPFARENNGSAGRGARRTAGSNSRGAWAWTLTSFRCTPVYLV
jgi:hypothetical protein